MERLLGCWCRLILGPQVSWFKSRVVAIEAGKLEARPTVVRPGPLLAGLVRF